MDPENLEKLNAMLDNDSELREVFALFHGH
jgi:hypothetical protein